MGGFRCVRDEGWKMCGLLSISGYVERQVSRRKRKWLRRSIFFLSIRSTLPRKGGEPGCLWERRTSSKLPSSFPISFSRRAPSSCVEDIGVAILYSTFLPSSTDTAQLNKVSRSPGAEHGTADRELACLAAPRSRPGNSQRQEKEGFQWRSGGLRVAGVVAV